MNTRTQRIFTITSALLLVMVLSLAVFSYSTEEEYFITIYKTYLSSIVSCALIIITGLFALYPKTLRNCKQEITPIDKILLVWILYLICLSCWSYYLPDWPKIINLIIIVLLYFTVRIILSNVYRATFIRIAAYGLLLSSIAQAIIGLLQFYGILDSLNELFPITGTFKNPAPFALFIGACFPVSISIWLFRTGKRTKNIRTIAMANIILSLLVLPLTGIRAVWLSVLIVSIFILELRYHPFHDLLIRIKNIPLRRISAVLLLLAVMLPICILLYKFKEPSANNRMLVWQISIAKFKQHPILGTGYGSFKGQYSKWQIDYFNAHPQILQKTYPGGQQVADFAGYVKMAYNEFLEIAVEQGIAGLLLFMAIVALITAKAFRLSGKEKSAILPAVTGGLLVILISGLTSYPFYSQPTYMLFFVLLAFMETKPIYSTREKEDTKGKTYNSIIIGSILIILPAFVLVHIVKNTESYMTYMQAKKLDSANEPGKALSIYEGLYKDLSHDPAYLLDYGINLLHNNQPDSALKVLRSAEKLDSDPRIYMLSGNVLKDQGSYKESEQMYKSAHLILPSRAYPKYLMALLYERRKDTVQALNMAEEIILMPVKNNDHLGERLFQEMQQMQAKYTVAGNRNK